MDGCFISFIRHNMDLISILGNSVLEAIYNSKNKSIRKFVLN